METRNPGSRIDKVAKQTEMKDRSLLEKTYREKWKILLGILASSLAIYYPTLGGGDKHHGQESAPGATPSLVVKDELINASPRELENKTKQLERAIKILQTVVNKKGAQEQQQINPDKLYITPETTLFAKEFSPDMKKDLDFIMDKMPALSISNKGERNGSFSEFDYLSPDGNLAGHFGEMFFTPEGKIVFTPEFEFERSLTFDYADQAIEVLKQQQEIMDLMNLSTNAALSEETRSKAKEMAIDKARTSGFLRSDYDKKK
ncbi:MAG: hypothetical protein A2261_01525 [Candidatus Magasanikbacteria bacterium RIFOXYA2_FULL_44_8]|uniref:Uncharacterized protein n=1 Tax=Candidatus Magasanikbacteria bacterium RIFOXYA2_FULL_44_8 TaxID=1798696 RepID=A0A1F6NJ77_9BACT|nr:MAG: hypothetical protein A2261_01525 [Candidatus Magasanikbacteria bacterium RIFOXYA2_FULL_44_8]